MGWGKNDFPNNNTNVYSKSMSKGYFESGIRLNNIYVSGLSGFGISVHYRYGPYALPNAKDNIYARMTLGVSF